MCKHIHDPSRNPPVEHILFHAVNKSSVLPLSLPTNQYARPISLKIIPPINKPVHKIHSPSINIPLPHLSSSPLMLQCPHPHIAPPSPWAGPGGWVRRAASPFPPSLEFVQYITEVRYRNPLDQHNILKPRNS